MSEDAARHAGEAFARKRKRSQPFDPAIGQSRRAAEFHPRDTRCGETFGQGQRCQLTLGHSGRHAAP